VLDERWRGGGCERGAHHSEKIRRLKGEWQGGKGGENSFHAKLETIMCRKPRCSIPPASFLGTTCFPPFSLLSSFSVSLGRQNPFLDLSQNSLQLLPPHQVNSLVYRDQPAVPTLLRP